MNNSSCPICKSHCCDKIDKNKRAIDYYNCNACGRIAIAVSAYGNVFNETKDMLSTYLYYNFFVTGKKDTYIAFIGSEDTYQEIKEQDSYIYVDMQTVKNWYPEKFSQKINIFLLGLISKQKFMGEKIILSDEQLKSACFVKTKFEDVCDDNIVKQQIDYFLKALSDMNYIEVGKDKGIIIKPDGLRRIDELERDKNLGKNIFVSMAFNDETMRTREAIRKGIIEAGYSSEFIDEIIHNHQIVPEMLRLIRECRLLVLDISEPNYGAYYEAGYALGYGKEVIICCREEIFNKQYSEEGKNQQYLKPHFDIAQKQILIWEDEADLSKKLSEWIKAIAG